jgi:hypothetical protein
MSTGNGIRIPIVALAATILVAVGMSSAQEPPDLSSGLKVFRRVDPAIPSPDRRGSGTALPLAPVASLTAGTAVVRVTIAPDGHVAAATLMEGRAALFVREATEALKKWMFEPVVADGRRVGVTTYLRVSFVPTTTTNSGMGSICVRLLGNTFAAKSPEVQPDCPGFGGNAIGAALGWSDVGADLARSAGPVGPEYAAWKAGQRGDGYEFRLTGVRNNNVYFASSASGANAFDWNCEDCSFLVWEGAGIGETTNPQRGVVFAKNPDGRSMEASCRATACWIDLQGPVFNPIRFETATLSLPLLNVRVVSPESTGAINLPQSNRAGQNPQPIYFHVTK